MLSKKRREIEYKVGKSVGSTEPTDVLLNVRYIFFNKFSV